MDCSLEPDSLTKEVVGGMGYGPIGLRLIGRFVVIGLLSQEINQLTLKGMSF